MAGTATHPPLSGAASYRTFTLHLIDASGDTWTELLLVALGATATAIQAWVALYQLVTQASVYQVTEQFVWAGDADPDNAESNMRSGGENGINLSIRNAATRELRPLRIVAPIPAILQGNQDIPLLSATAMTNLIVATLALEAGFNLQSAQYTTRRERRNNPRVK